MSTTVEKYVAIVDANNDPEFRGRIRIRCADLTGDPDVVLPGWAEPVFDWGWFAIPDVDEFVEIEVITGSTEDEVPGQSMILNPQITWRAKRYYHTGGDTETPIHEDFTSGNYGKRRGFATPAGHILLFDDTEGQERVQLTWHQIESSEDKFSYLALDPDGSIIIGNKKGSLIYLDAKNGAITLNDEHGNIISSDSEGVRLIDKFSNIIDMKDGAILLMGKGGVTLNCKTAALKAGSVELGRTATLGVARLTDLVVAGASMATWIANVVAALGTLGQVVVPPTDFGVISTASTVAKAE